MKKVTDFIVKGRYIFLAIFIVLAGLCIFLNTKVNINEDIMKYLPSTSETKIGYDIMNEEFAKQDSSTLNVMFKDLNDIEKEQIFNEFKEIKGVSSVEYDNSDTYNIDEYTLYVVNVDDYSDSKTSEDVYNYINDNYKTEAMSGSIYEENKTILHLWVVILAIACAMVILVLLSESYLEPFLYLIAIGIAVFINKGTNIMFDSVSSITDSITAILQLALSMDYSIMLSNRYKQEKERNKNKVEAMKEALYASFKSISSSSITTVVGLLALIFMSFTIGKDLGIVLAKGVILSLICIFFCLPALLLIFDNLIAKTKKHSMHFNLTKIGNFSYKTRYGQLIAIIIVFVLAFIFKGNVGITYTGSEQDKVGQVFKSNNQIAIVYENRYEDIISSYCKKLESDENIDQVLCYGNTINEKEAYDELNNKFSDLGQDTDIDEYLIKIIYYNYYTKDTNNKMTYDEFITFIKSDIYSNEDLSSNIDNNTKDNINKLNNFTNTNSINEQRTVKDIASILDLSEEDASKILLYYNSKNLNTEITLKDFVNFILDDVVNDPTYSSSISKSTINSLKTIRPYLDSNTINKEMTIDEISNTFGIDKNIVSKLFLFYSVNNESSTTMTLNEFANFIYGLKINDTYKDYVSKIDDNTLNTLMLLSNTTLVNTKVDYETMYNYLLSYGFDKETITNIYVYNYMFNNPDMDSNSAYIATVSKMHQLSINELISFILNRYNENDPIIYTNLTYNQAKTLNEALYIISISDIKYNYNDIANIFNISNKETMMLYGLYDYNNSHILMSPYTFVNIIINNKDNELLKSSLSDNTLSNLYLVETIMESTLNNTKYDAYALAKLLNSDVDTLRLVLALYDSKYIKANTDISLNEFVTIIVDDMINNPKYSNNFTNEQITKLNTIKEVMNSSINGTKYTSYELYTTLSKLSDSLDINLVELVYMYYGSVYEYNNNWNLTVEEFITYLHNDVLNDNTFKDFISDDKRETINNGYDKILKSKDLIVSPNYSRVVLNTKYDHEGEETTKFIEKLEKDLGSNEGIYIVGNSPMAVEMSKTFNGELNKITLLTMLFIFVVVALTFKDLIIPIVLVLIIQCAVYITMSAITITGGTVYFIALLIVQAILMGATIDYAIVYTSYYRESRLSMGIKDSIVNAYNRSIHTILSSSLILIIVTLVVANFASAIAGMICETISEGTFAAVILILFILPGILAATDKFICRKGYYKEKKVVKKKTTKKKNNNKNIKKKIK